MDPKDHDVIEWVLGPQRQRERKPIKAKTIFAFGPTVYVEEADTGRWLVGRQPKPDGRDVECDAQFADLQALIDASAFAPLPKPPDGFTLREVARLPNFPSRLASDGTGRVLYVLCVTGDVWRLEPATGALKQILFADKYLDPDIPDRMLVGMTLDKKGRLYLVANQRDERPKIVTNRVVIYRTTETTADGDPAAPKPWLKASYPWGIGPFNHGVGHIAFGPDGMLYVNSGSRTDGDETGDDPRYSKEGEDRLTSCIWRLDPKADKPEIEIYARGLRNAYGFCWNDKGEMYATDNGPDADPPEELNHIEKGKHYGFPYRFSDWIKPPYVYTPDPPAGLTLHAAGRQPRPRRRRLARPAAVHVQPAFVAFRHRLPPRRLPGAVPRRLFRGPLRQSAGQAARRLRRAARRPRQGRRRPARRRRSRRCWRRSPGRSICTFRARARCTSANTRGRSTTAASTACCRAACWSWR